MQLSAAADHVGPVRRINRYFGSEFGAAAPHDPYAAYDDVAFDPSHYPVGPGGAGSSAAHAAMPFDDHDAEGDHGPFGADQYSMGPEGAGASATHAALQSEHLGASASDPSDEGPLGTDGVAPHLPLGLPPDGPVSAAQPALPPEPP